VDRGAEEAAQQVVLGVNAWIWFCHPDQSGNVHPNDAGYEDMADAFLDVITS
jgi:hypothetical protein